MKIFIYHKSHPVYQEENARLRHRMEKIRQNEKEKDNECNTLIAKGKVVWNDKIIDHNLFFTNL